MGFIAAIILIALVAVGVAVYQLVKSKKAVTVADVKTQIATDAASVKADVKKS